MARKKPLPKIGKLAPGTRLRDYDPADVEARRKALHAHRQARYVQRRFHATGAKDITLSLSKAAQDKLAAAAKRAGVSRSFYADTLICKHAGAEEA